ncbi:glycosyl transferase [Christiangramia fulva]|uniref:Glycosyl transferase n=1 Tax=Christiangramia fulva TaxID=2126553 RepID=A0A2R3Z0L3_9FLAO|nr:glycosyltransferase family 2 protein [Christiangramia fulva]AVR43796.1 glycosyl transferase [Christiangramia fulva]
MNKKLSILIPAYNEAETIGELPEVLKDLDLGLNLDMEIIIVDDCSTDSTKEIINQFIQSNKGINTKLLEQESNKGKGAALHRAISECTGDFAVIQDADLEYDPHEYINLLKPILKGRADVVYGSRFMGGYAHRILFFWHSIGNKFLTTLSNAFTNLNLTDMETCYKMFRTEILKSLDLKEKKFGFEPEVTAKISRIPGIRIYEVGISYYGRTYVEGKKIKWKDGVEALWCILKYNLFRNF